MPAAPVIDLSSSRQLAVVAIDGPVGVGKSTIARRVAENVGLRHIDTGAMYRAVALAVMRLPERVSRNGETLARVARESIIELAEDGSVLLDGADISADIRDESVSQFVGIVADSLEVRRALVEQQRRLGGRQPSIMEGRDIGTVVFPDAALKIFLDAAPRVRASRRVEQLISTGRPADPQEVLARLIERDQRDRAREWGGLRQAADARLVDTTCFEEDFVVELVCAMVREHPAFRHARMAAR